MLFRSAFAAALGAHLGVMASASPVAGEQRVPHASGLAAKKAPDPARAPEARALLGTLVQTHSDEIVPLDDAAPDGDRFSVLLADRVTGKKADLDPHLLDLLRALAREHAPARIELVSGYRSPKLNEILRKKGHHVATHSQHSLGHAVDFRLFSPGEATPRDPREVEADVRALGWGGGVGVYEGKDDRFVHADVGPRRRWDGQ